MWVPQSQCLLPFLTVCLYSRFRNQMVTVCSATWWLLPFFFLTSWTSWKEADEQVQWAQGKVYQVHLEGFFFSTLGYFVSVLKFFMFITHRRQESLMPSSRGGVGRMLPKIIGTCHTDGMEMMHNMIFSWLLRRKDDFRMVFSWWLGTGQLLCCPHSSALSTIYIELSNKFLLN